MSTNKFSFNISSGGIDFTISVEITASPAAAPVVPALDPIKRVFVKSSNIRSIGYRREDGTLEVEFHSGKVYRYTHVPHRIADEFTVARSHGTYFNDYIKGQFETLELK